MRSCSTYMQRKIYEPESVWKLKIFQKCSNAAVMHDTIFLKLNIKFSAGVEMAIVLNLRMSSACFGILIFVVSNTTAAQHSSNQIQNSKDFETLDYLHDRIVIAIGNFIIAWNERIRWYQIKLVTLISIFCDHRVFAKNIQSLDAENGLFDSVKF